MPLRTSSGILLVLWESYRQAIALQEALAREDGDNPAYHQGLAASLINLGYLRCTGKGLDDLDAAQRHFLRAREIYAELVRQFPRHPPYRKDLVKGDINLGFVRFQRKEWAGAEEAGSQAEAGARALVKDHPQVLESRGRVPSAAATLPKEEATLSRELRTPSLPRTHLPVGYRWQNSECHRPVLRPQHSYISDLVSHVR
jgi:hypothetical protein